MLSESHAAASSAGLAFVALLLMAAALPPLVAAWLRSRLLHDRPADRPGHDPALEARLRGGRLLPVLQFGDSPRTRRSPRHAVTAHRLLMTTPFLTGTLLVLLGFVAAIGPLDRAGLLLAVAFVVPVFIVVLHGRRRDLGPERASEPGQARAPARDSRSGLS